MRRQTTSLPPLGEGNPSPVTCNPKGRTSFMAYSWEATGKRAHHTPARYAQLVPTDLHPGGRGWLRDHRALHPSGPCISLGKLG